LRLAYLGGLALCSLGAARHWRNRDPRLLIAMATPWLLMFALLGQMHERYLMWGAVVSAVALGVSLRLSVVHFIISAMSTAMIVHVMLVDKKLETTLHVVDMLHGVRPYASGLLLAVWQSVCGTVFQPVFPDSSDDGDKPAQKKCLLCHSDRRLKKSKLTDASKVR